MRVLVVDDHPAFRKALTSALRMVADIEVAGEAGGGVAACEEAEELEPDVVLMDLSMPDLSGIDAMKKIHETHARPARGDPHRACRRRRRARGARGRRQGVPRQGHGPAGSRDRAARSRGARRARTSASPRAAVAAVSRRTSAGTAPSAGAPRDHRDVVEQRLKSHDGITSVVSRGLRRSRSRSAASPSIRRDLAEVAAGAEGDTGTPADRDLGLAVEDQVEPHAP